MTTVTVTLPEPLERFVSDRVAAGTYETPEQATLDLLERARADHVRRTDALKAAVQIGLDDLEAGRFEDVAIEDLDDWLAEVAAKARSR